MSSRLTRTDDMVRIDVPGQREGLAPVGPDRVRAFKRHLVGAMRDLAKARRPERLIQKRSPEPRGLGAQVVAAGCAHCAGSCCMAGGTHAFIDERTMARVRAERPGMDARAVLRAYVGAIGREAVAGSCVFHGPAGCTLERGLRAELCNAYHCNGLRDFLKAPPEGVRTILIRTHDGEERRLDPVPVARPSVG